MEFTLNLDVTPPVAAISNFGDWKIRNTEWGYELYDESSIYILLSFGQGKRTHIIIAYLAPDQTGEVWFNMHVPTADTAATVTNVINANIQIWANSVARMTKIREAARG